MLKTLSLATALSLALVSQSFGQNANTRTQATGTRTSTANSNVTPAGETPAATRTRRAAGSGQAGSGGRESVTEGVVAAFDALIDGIRRADVNAVTSVYWNSPRLLLFNYNGSVTKGWEQMRKNRESSYPELKDVKIEVHDRRVEMLGRDGAVVTCLWTQSQTFRGTPETATGRMTLVFRRAGTTWKAVHLHTSPDAPDPARLPPSEQTTTPPPRPTATPTPKPGTTP
ncbi:MAG TPA: nuclear transport factor 2 family protein [Pyrinomonadaceae bacterium]|jgi:ketosteroid isomerase-like protein|nr:nuclear transport factor 2 family protein [Pyrinomonadaceae bacterium]